jgi:LPS O-antigen subunit length determinant protein (WzzB/FepE family)
MTLLLLNNEIRVMQERLLRIERELNVELPERQQTFLNELANIKRDQKQQSGAIALIASELSNLRATRLLQDTSRSLLPVTPRRSLIVLLSIVFGGVLSLVVALVLDAVKLLRGSPPA